MFLFNHPTAYHSEKQNDEAISQPSGRSLRCLMILSCFGKVTPNRNNILTTTLCHCKSSGQRTIPLSAENCSLAPSGTCTMHMLAMIKWQAGIHKTASPRSNGLRTSFSNLAKRHHPVRRHPTSLGTPFSTPTTRCLLCSSTTIRPRDHPTTRPPDHATKRLRD